MFSTRRLLEELACAFRMTEPATAAAVSAIAAAAAVVAAALALTAAPSAIARDRIG